MNFLLPVLLARATLNRESQNSIHSVSLMLRTFGGQTVDGVISNYNMTKIPNGAIWFKEMCKLQHMSLKCKHFQEYQTFCLGSLWGFDISTSKSSISFC